MNQMCEICVGMSQGKAKVGHCEGRHTLWFESNNKCFWAISDDVDQRDTADEDKSLRAFDGADFGLQYDAIPADSTWSRLQVSKKHKVVHLQHWITFSDFGSL